MWPHGESGLVFTAYIAHEGSFTILPGQTTQTITVAVTGRRWMSTTRRSPANGFVLINWTATGAILNDDDPPALKISGRSVVEGHSGESSLVFTTNGTALADSDYTAQSGTLTFPPARSPRSSPSRSSARQRWRRMNC